MTPLARLQGLRAAHVGPGSGTWTMPASAALQLPGAISVIEISAFIETALTGVTMTAMPPGVTAEPRTLAINYFRPNRPQSGSLLARGRVVNMSTLFAFTEVEIEDPEGRHIAHAAGQCGIRPLEPPPPPPPTRLRPVEEAVYATPDPHLRPVVARAAPPEEWERHGGLVVMRGYLDGTYVMPLGELYGLPYLEVDEGRVLLPSLPRSGSADSHEAWRRVCWPPSPPPVSGVWGSPSLGRGTRSSALIRS